MKAWHFLHEGSIMRDGHKAPEDGVMLKHDGPLVICQSGLHTSIDPFDALQHAPGPVLCYVECGGEVVRQKDKLVCTERTIIARMDFTEPLRFFARMQALQATQYWDAPDIVLEYLMTGEETIREAAARAAAKSAARNATRNAAWAATWGAAWGAACDAAWGAAWAAKAAAWAAAWADARADAAAQDFRDLVAECFEGVLKERTE